MPVNGAFRVTLLAVCSIPAALATRIDLQVGDIHATAQTYIVGSGNIDAVPPYPNYLTPLGAGYDGVADLILGTSRGTFRCTGSMLGSGQHILTAAHCVTDPSGNLDLIGGTASFFPSTGGTEAISFAGVEVYPTWNGDPSDGDDLAIISLAHAASAGVQRYGLYTGTDELGQIYNVVGFGRRGSNGEGYTTESGTRRQGQNTFDATLAGIGFGSANVLMSDFDSGLPANDGFRFHFNFAEDLGLGFSEVSTALGDSGGPSFIGGRIAGITSFGATFRQQSNGASSDISPDSTNSSWGEFNGMTRVSTYAGWILANSDVPEAGSLLLIGLGLAGFGMLARRRKKY